MTDDYKPLWHQSGVNAKGEPFVQLILGDTVLAQLDPEMARDHAMAVLEATEAAEQDAFLVGFLQRECDLSLLEATNVLVTFRRERDARTGKRGGPTRLRDWVFPPQ